MPLIERNDIKSARVGSVIKDGGAELLNSGTSNQHHNSQYSDLLEDSEYP